jgi:hypothetical protein
MAGADLPEVDPLFEAHIWVRLGEAPSVSFHVHYASGSLDRLFT